MLLDVQDNARLLDLVAVDANGQPLGTLTEDGIYRYGYEWENASGRSTTHALYLSDEWQATEKLRIDGGVRWEEVNAEGWTEIRHASEPRHLRQFPNPYRFGPVRHYDETFNKTGWTIGANWQFSEHSGLFARWTSAFRLPNLSSYITRYSNCSLIDVEACIRNNSSRRSPRPWIWARWATSSATKPSTCSLPRSTPSMTTSASTTPCSPSTHRPGSSRVSPAPSTFGLEFEGSWYPAEWFDVQLTATLQEPEYKDLPYTEVVSGAPVLRDFVGNQLIRVPKVSCRMVPGLNLFDSKLRLQAAYEHQGERFVDTANSVRLPSYSRRQRQRALRSRRPSCRCSCMRDNLTNSLGRPKVIRAPASCRRRRGANTFIARPLLGGPIVSRSCRF